MNRPSITNLIRQYSDGELNDEQAAQVKQHLQEHPEDQAIVEYEQALRKRIEAVVKADCPKAPAGLADQIKDELAKHDVSSDSEMETYAYSPRSWSFGPNKANVFAVAASLALVVGAVLFGIFGNPIDRPYLDKSHAAEAAGFVGLEHIQVAANKDRLEMLTSEYKTCKEAQEACIKMFRADIPMFDLSELGYKFKGGTACSVPHCDRACHMFFESAEGKGLVSIHLVRDVGNLSLGDGEPFESRMPLRTSRFFLDGGEVMGNKPCVIAFSDGEIMYMVMACEFNDTEKVISSIQASIVNQGP